MKKTLFLSLALSAFSSVALAGNVTHERKIDCMGEFVSLSSILQLKRSQGENVPFSDIQKISNAIEAIGYNFGKSLVEKDKSEQDRMMKLMISSLKNRESGLLRQLSSQGVPSTLEVVRTRTEECFSELGEIAERRL